MAPMWQDGVEGGDPATRHRFWHDTHGGRLLRSGELSRGQLLERGGRRRGELPVGRRRTAWGAHFRFRRRARRVASRVDTFQSFKRLLNDPSPEATLQVGSTELRIVDLLARFFSALRTALVARSNLAPLLGKAEPLQVFVAAPANAHSTQRFSVPRCVSARGLRCFRLAQRALGRRLRVHPPLSQHAHRQQRSRVGLRHRRGTFDVSLLRMSGPLHEVIATSGINRLGGDDFDNELLMLCLSKLGLARESLERASRAPVARAVPTSRKSACTPRRNGWCSIWRLPSGRRPPTPRSRSRSPIFTSGARRSSSERSTR